MFTKSVMLWNCFLFIFTVVVCTYYVLCSMEIAVSPFVDSVIAAYPALHFFETASWKQKFLGLFAGFRDEDHLFPLYYLFALLAKNFAAHPTEAFRAGAQLLSIGTVVVTGFYVYRLSKDCFTSFFAMALLSVNITLMWRNHLALIFGLPTLFPVLASCFTLQTLRSPTVLNYFILFVVHATALFSYESAFIVFPHSAVFVCLFYFSRHQQQYIRTLSSIAKIGLVLMASILPYAIIHQYIYSSPIPTRGSSAFVLADNLNNFRVLFDQYAFKIFSFWGTKLGIPSQILSNLIAVVLAGMFVFHLRSLAKDFVPAALLGGSLLQFIFVSQIGRTDPGIWNAMGVYFTVYLAYVIILFAKKMGKKLNLGVVEYSFPILLVICLFLVEERFYRNFVEKGQPYYEHSNNFQQSLSKASEPFSGNFQLVAKSDFKYPFYTLMTENVIGMRTNKSLPSFWLYNEGHKFHWHNFFTEVLKLDSQKEWDVVFPALSSYKGGFVTIATQDSFVKLSLDPTDNHLFSAFRIYEDQRQVRVYNILLPLDISASPQTRDLELVLTFTHKLPPSIAVYRGDYSHTALPILARTDKTISFQLRLPEKPGLYQKLRFEYEFFEKEENPFFQLSILRTKKNYMSQIDLYTNRDLSVESPALANEAPSYKIVNSDRTGMFTISTEYGSNISFVLKKGKSIIIKPLGPIPSDYQLSLEAFQLNSFFNKKKERENRVGSKLIPCTSDSC